MSVEPKTSSGPSSRTGEEEKKLGGYDVGVYAPTRGGDIPPVYTQEEEPYDPSQESRMTRLGLNIESFKRAPGTTRGLVAHGDIPPEYLQHDNPLLQQKMKPRHLQMIAVGESVPPPRICR